MARILIFDDEPNRCADLAGSLQAQGHRVSITREQSAKPSHPPYASPDPARARQATWWAYMLALVAPAAFVSARLEVGFHNGDPPAVVLLVLPIILCAYVGGLGPGLLATAIAALGTDFFLLTPQYIHLPLAHAYSLWSIAG